MNDFWKPLRNQSFLQGYFHLADENTPRYSPGLLFVFVHGWCGSPIGTWGQLPEWILTSVNVDVDILNLEYASHLHLGGSIDRAVAELKQSINLLLPNATGRDYSHVFFWTHSTGGLVVKRLWLQDMHGLDTQVLKFGDSDERPPIALRTRRIENIAVPHRGAHALKSWPGAALYAPLGLLAQLLWIPGNLFKKGRKLGFQWINLELVRNHPKLLAMNRDLENQLKFLKEMHLPQPASREILADDDIVVREQDAGKSGYSWVSTEELLDREKAIRLFANHSRVKLPERPDDPIVDILANPIKYWTAEPRYQEISLRTIVLTLRWLKQSIGSAREDGEDSGSGGLAVFRNLMKRSLDDRAAASIKTTVDGARPGTQKDVLDRVVRNLVEGTSHPPILITGEAGLGKTTTIHMAARYQASRILDHELRGTECDPSANALPIYVPLRLLKMRDGFRTAIEDGSNEALLYEILAAWCDYLNVRGVQLKIAPDWVLEVLRHLPATLYLDGVDEFLAAHGPRLNVDHLIQLTEWLTNGDFAGNDGLRVVLGIRSNAPKVSSWVSDLRAHEIVRLTEEQVDQVFPGLAKTLSEVNSGSRRLLLSPLVLTQLGPLSDRPGSGQLDNQARVFEFTFRTMLFGRDGPSALQKKDENLTTWLDVLGCVAWCFFEARIDISRRHVFEEAILRERIGQEAEGWARHAGTVGDAGAGRVARTVQNHLNKIQDGDLWRLICENTVLVREDDSHPVIWFLHEYWYEYLVAWYMRRIIEGCHPTKLSPFGPTLLMYELCGQMLSNTRGFRVSSQDVAAVLEAANSKPGAIFGNFSAVLANSSCEIDPPAVGPLVADSPIDAQFNLSRAVRLWGLATRVLRDSVNQEPETTRGLRNGLTGTFLAELEAPDVGQIRSSAAWSFLQAFGKSGERVEAGQRPTLLLDATHMRQIAGELCQPDQDPLEGLSDTQRVLQGSMMAIRHSLLDDPQRLISVLHYMAFMVAVFCEGHRVSGVETGLDEFFQDNGNFAPFYMGADDGTDIQKAYSELRQTYLNRRLAGSARGARA